MLDHDCYTAIEVVANSKTHLAFNDRLALSRAFPALLASISDSPPDARAAGSARLLAALSSCSRAAPAVAAGVAGEVLHACIDALGVGVTHATAARAIVGVLRGGGLAALLRHGGGGGGARPWPATVQLLVALPDHAARGAAAAGAELPVVLQATGFFALLECACCEVVASEDAAAAGSAPEDAAVVTDALERTRTLAEKLLRLGRARSLGACWAGLHTIDAAAASVLHASGRGWQCLIPPHSTDARAQGAALEAAVEVVATEALMHAAEAGIGGSSSPDAWSCAFVAALERVVGACSQLPSVQREHLLGQLLLRKPLPGFLSHALIRFTLGHLVPSSAHLHEFLLAVPLLQLASAWSSASYCSTVPVRSQESATRALLHALALAPDAAFGVACPLLTELMGGVQTRMDDPTRALHAAGLRVAAAFSARLTPESPLTFEELEGGGAGGGDGDVSLADAIARCKSGSDGALAVFDEAPADVTRAGVSPAALVLGFDAAPPSDPPAPSSLVSPAKGGALADSRDMGSGAHRLALARAQYAAKQPAHLAAAYTVLSKWHTAAGSGDGSLDGGEAATAALATLAHTVRAAAGDEGEAHQVLALAAPLLRLVSALEDRSAIGVKWAAWRFAAMQALLVCAAPMGAVFLWSRLAGREVSEGHRYELLDVAVAAARELSGDETCDGVLPPPPWEDPDWAPEDVDDAPGAAEELAAALREEAAARCGSSSDGGGARAAPPPPQPRMPCNLFAEVAAPYFFCPLLRLVTGCSAAGEAAGGGVSTLGGLSWDSPLLQQHPTWKEDVAELLGGSSGGGALGDLTRPLDLRGPGHELLLAQALRALAVFLEAAGVHVTDTPAGGGAPAAPAAVAMAAALLAAAWLLRVHTNAGVRRAALVALAAVIASVSRGGEAWLLAPSVLAPLTREAPVDIAVGESVLHSGSGGGRGGILGELSSLGSRGTIAAGDLTSRLAREASVAAAAAHGAAAAGIGSALSAQLSGITTGDTRAGSQRGLTIDTAGGACVWDDLVEVAVWLSNMSTAEVDDEARALARGILGSSLFKMLLVGEEGG